MNVKTGPVRGGSRLRRHRGDKFRLTTQHLFRGLQQEASALGGYRIAPLRERRAGGSGAAAGVRQAGGAGNGGAFVRERVIAGKGGMTFSIMPLAVGVQIAGYCHYWLLLALRFAECIGLRRRAVAVGRLSPAFFVTLRRVHIYEEVR